MRKLKGENKMDNKILDELLRFDPIAEAERVSGKQHWSEFSKEDEYTAMALAMLSGDMKRNALKEANDTYFSMKFGEFIDLIISNGFKKAIQYKFKNTKTYLGETDEFACYYRNDGLVIICDSCGDSLNGGDIYGNYKRNDNEKCWIGDGSSSPIGDGIIGFGKDVREGMFHFISKVNNIGEILPIWKGSGCFNWMLDRTERSSDGEPYESWSKRYRNTTLDKIKKCPKEFQDIVAVYVNEK
jgi:hypothetical protein